MNKISQFHTINENSSQDKLIQFFPIEKNQSNPKPLIDRINKNKVDIQKITLNGHPININKVNTYSNSNRSKNNIFFDDFVEKKSESVEESFEKGNKGKKKRKTIFERIEYNPLSAIDSLKLLKMNEDKTSYGKNFNNIKICEICLGIFSLFSIILAILDNEIYIKKN